MFPCARRDVTRGCIQLDEVVFLYFIDAVGAGFGGLILLSFGYGGLGTLGMLSIIASILFKFYAVDPARAHRNDI